MALVASHTRKSLFWSILIVAAVSFMAGDTAMAQRHTGGMRRRPRRPERKKPEQPRQSHEDERAPAPGSQEGYIVRYKPADEADRKEDPDLIGVLKIKPYGKKTSVMSLQVRRQEDLKVMLGDHKIELDEFEKYLRRRLDVVADWAFLDPDSKRDDKYKKKVLRTLTFKAIEVEGEVDEILEGGRLVVYGTPANDQQWPDYVPDDSPGNSMKKEKPRKKKLKLFVIDDISKFMKEDSDQADLSDFKEGDKVRVTVVYASTKPGYLLKMRPPGMNEVAPPKEDGGDRRPPAPRPPRPPRGGRGHRGGGGPQG